MKHTFKTIAGLLAVAGLQLGPMTGCVGGYVDSGGPEYYGGEPWVQTDVVVGGGGGWFGGHRDNAYAHPDGNRSGGGHAAPRAEHAAAPRASSSGSKQEEHRK
jgi:hypothetical protein